jgi:superfamily I DNA/RNA helicase
MYDLDLIDETFEAKEYPPTAEQRQLVETIAQAFYGNRDGRKIIVCKAVAGAGKTATSLDVYNVLTSNLEGQTIQCVAFNVKAKDEMIARGVEPKHAKTLNGLGHSNLSYYARNRGLKLDVQDGLKVSNLLRRTDRALAEIAPARRFAKKLIDFVKAHGLKTFDRETLEGLADHYEVFIDLTYEECEDTYNITLDELESKTYEWIGRTMVENNRVPTEGDWVIDFNDQVYLPVVLGIRCFQNDLMIVDEAQDLSLANKRLVDKCLKKNGVLVLVGDDYQCIYAWRGCEVDGLSKTLGRTNLDVTAAPLTYNWRSGKQIIEFAQTICPDIQCGNGQEATVSDVGMEDFDVLKLEGDVAVLSRLRAPLVSYAIECLKADKPFTFQFSLKFLIDTIKQIGDSDLSIRAFKRHLATYVETKRVLYTQQDADTALEDLEDFAAIMDTILEKVRTTDKVSDLVDYIKELDRRIKASDGSLCLSTIHGSKGLEWDTTYIIGYAEIGNRATKDWKVTEARNLRFVAATRAKTNLIFLQEQAA